MKNLIVLLAAICFFCISSLNSRSQVPSWEWARSAGGPGLSDYASSIAVDPAGNVYAAGHFGSSTITFGTTVLVNVAFEDIFLVKYDNAGNVLWAKSFGGDYTEEARSLSTDASGNIIMAGIFASSTLTFGSTTLTNAGNTDLFLTKLDADGNVLWAKSAGGISGDYAGSVTASPYGNVYFTGYSYSPSITFDSITFTNQGVFLVTYNPDGNILWAKGSGGTHSFLHTSVAVDASGNSYISGTFWGDTLIFSPVILRNTKADAGDIFLVKYDTGGNVLWAKSTGGRGNDYGESIDADASGNLFFCGSFHSSSIIFDSIILLNPDSAVTTGLFITKYDQFGNVLWAKKAGGMYNDNATSVAVDSSGNSYLAGNFNCDTLDFGTVKLANTVPNYTDIFVAKYDVGGNVQWATHASGAENEDTYTMASDPAGNVYVAGMYKGTSVTFGITTLINLGWWDLFVAKLGSTNVGINGPDRSSNLSVFPNPAAGFLNILLNQKTVIEISTIEGRIIKTIDKNELQATIDIQSLSNGVYLLKAKTDEGVMIRKFIEQ